MSLKFYQSEKDDKTTDNMLSARRVMNSERWASENDENDRLNSDIKFYDEKSMTLIDDTIVLSSKYNDLFSKWVILILQIIDVAQERAEFYLAIFIIKHMIAKWQFKERAIKQLHNDQYFYQLAFNDWQMHENERKIAFNCLQSERKMNRSQKIVLENLCVIQNDEYISSAFFIVSENLFLSTEKTKHSISLSKINVSITFVYISDIFKINNSYKEKKRTHAEFIDLTSSNASSFQIMTQLVHTSLAKKNKKIDAFVVSNFLNININVFSLSMIIAFQLDLSDFESDSFFNFEALRNLRKKLDVTQNQLRRS